MTVDGALRRKVEDWIAQDPDPVTRAELEELLAKGDEPELRDRFAGPLEFGTAGLRGVLGGGPGRMNRLVVARATAGLCRYLQEQVSDAAERGICIGYDGRRLSRTFAEDAAAVVAGAGIRVHLFDRMVPTPVLAFAALDRKAAAAIMITASHNPPAYNGYKVYWENGAQIIPPHDVGIARRIGAVGSYASIPRLEPEQARSEGLLHDLGDELEERYLEGIQGLLPQRQAPEDLSIAYTALHGVGQRFVLRALRQAGFRHLSPVIEQGDADPSFSTVSFPNPEEKGAMDRVLALAERERADLVLANDPDADRLAASVRARDGTYRTLTGNELGCLLGHYVLSQGDPQARRLVISTVVSSPMLGAIARAHGARWEQTLTGFKWIANRAMELEAQTGLRFEFGYEEALGYTVGGHVRDKDGISSAAVIADMAAWCKANGRTLLDELETCWRRYGMYLSRQVSATHEGPGGSERIAQIMETARRNPPHRIGDQAVLAVEDYQAGTRTPPGGQSKALAFPKANMVLLELEGGHRAMLRPSGTEPKIKYYIDVRIELADDETVGDAWQRGETFLDGLSQSLRDQVEPAG
jgi:phosphomannomutase